MASFRAAGCAYSTTVNLPSRWKVKAPTWSYAHRHARDYPPQVAERLVFIRDAQAAGLTLAEIRGVLAIRDAGQPPCHHVIALINAHPEQVDQRITELLATHTALHNLRQRAQSVNPADCAPGEICSIVTLGMLLLANRLVRRYAEEVRH
ncbi:MerR family DNA-binding protein [Nonomuraea sp. 10N515B]|uniref:MerR family DNA-binding protein n=1 Tax=Nonomuraea sp. 10N515B TaxID=3457422 RepID=UPI003FCC3317